MVIALIIRCDSKDKLIVHAYSSCLPSWPARRLKRSAVCRRRRRTTPICIWFGFPDRAFTCTFPKNCCTSGISQRYYELGGPAAGNRRADFFYYDVPSSQMCDLGWYTVFRGQEFLICEKWARLERGELLFTYRLGKPGLGYGRKQYNDKISGMTILGEVLSTKRETVCLKLDIDEGWAPGGPYPYTWRPETGNMMYCMPQVGTRVSLYFPNYDEQTAIAVNCVRTNGSSCARMSDPSKRSFVTEHGKEMNLYPQEMSFLGGANGTVKLEDETGITISTDKRIQIVAQQTVQVNGQKVEIYAPNGELTLEKGNALTGKIETSIIQSGQYDLLAVTKTHMSGRNHKTFEAHDDALKETAFNWGELALNVVAGIAVAAVVATVCVLSAGLGGAAILAATAIGASFVIAKAYNDYKCGTISSITDYMITGAFGGLAGSFSVIGVAGTYFTTLAAKEAGRLLAMSISRRVISVLGLSAFAGGMTNFAWQILVDKKTVASVNYFDVYTSALTSMSLAGAFNRFLIGSTLIATAIATSFVNSEDDISIFTDAALALIPFPEHGILYREPAVDILKKIFGNIKGDIGANILEDVVEFVNKLANPNSQDESTMRIIDLEQR